MLPVTAVTRNRYRERMKAKKRMESEMIKIYIYKKEKKESEILNKFSTFRKKEKRINENETKFVT